MHRLSNAVIAAVATMTFAQIASAADMPLKAPAAVVTPAYNWTGWYLGVNAGGDWGSSDPTTTFGTSAIAPNYPPTGVAFINAVGAPSRLNTSGFTGGVHGGYNWQSGNLLVGVEADFEYFRSAGSQTVIGPLVGASNAISITSSISTDWLFTARPRLGFVFNDWLFYGTGGLAVTQVKASWNYFESFNSIRESASVSSTKAGWVGGGGVEVGLPGNLSLGAEYLYVKFGSVSATGSNLAFATGVLLTNPVNHSADLASNLVRARLTKKF